MREQLVLVRVHRALRDALPPRLLASVMTPAGDLAGLMVLAWNVDWALLAILAGLSSLTVALVHGGSAMALGTAAGAATILGASLRVMTRARLRHSVIT